MGFVRATREKAKARIGIVGPAGSGKTFSALQIARGLVGPDGRIALVDTEHGSAAKYADVTEFDVDEYDEFDPRRLMKSFDDAEAAGYDCLIIDSLSHFWTGKGGILDQVDKATKRSKSGNAFSAGWREASPLHGQMVDRLLSSKMHVIATMRAKTAYEMQDDRGKKVPVKIGLAPIQRDGMEFEFDICGDIDHGHNFVVTKSRMIELQDGVFSRPGIELGQLIRAWCQGGADPAVVTDQNKPDGWAASLDACASAGDLASWALENRTELIAMDGDKKRMATGIVKQRCAALGADFGAVVETIKSGGNDAAGQ